MIGFDIYKYERMLIGDPSNKTPELVGNGLYAPERNINLEKNLNEGKYLLLITTYYAEVWEDFTMVIWSKRSNIIYNNSIV